MLFNFQLRPLSDVTPWVYSEQLYLQWFGLTEGCYWLQMNDKDEFFRYSADLLVYWQENYPTEPVRPPYADYYVVRFWEDLLEEILPVILEPLHPRLAHMLGTDELHRWQKRIKHWETLFEADDDNDNNESDMEIWDTYMQATSWWYDRQLSAHPLLAPPRLWFWNDGHSIHAFWDNSQRDIDDIPAWTAQRGRIQLTNPQFLDEVHSFHTRFLATMEERIQEAKSTSMLTRQSRAQSPFLQPKPEGQKIYAPHPQKGADPARRFWPHPDIAINFDRLAEEQHHRTQLLAQSLERTVSRSATDWEAVFEAMGKMDDFSRFTPSE
ncbi:MAG TPA: DUF5984 family protein [Ktedonobacteraceae bacterium]